MFKQKNNSLQIFLIFFFFSLSLVISYIAIDNIFFADKTKKIALDNAIKKTLEREQIIVSFTDKARHALTSIRELNVFKKYQNTYIDNDIKEVFLAFGKAQKNLMQLRYIDKNGFEKIRIDRDSQDSKAKIISKDTLQNKSDRYYFTESKSKELEKVWFSALDLNIENNKVEIPYKPTLRAILPLKQNNEFGGILIMNFFTEGFLKNLLNMPLYDGILINKYGDTLLHFQKEKSWSSYKKGIFNIKQEFPDVYKKVLNQNLFINKQLVSRKLNSPIKDDLIMILQLNGTYALKQEKEAIKQYLLVAFTTVLFSILLSIFTIKIFRKQLGIIRSSFDTSIDTASQIANIGFWEYDVINNKVTCNLGTCKILGTESTKQKITFEKFLSYLYHKDKEKMLSAYNKSILEKTDYISKHRLLTEKNNIKFIEERAKHYYDTAGKHIKSIGSIYDVTDITTLKDEQLQQQKMLLTQSKVAAVGEMIGNISHQWRQPLSIITTTVSGIKLRLNFGEKVTEDELHTMIDTITQQSLYLSKTIDDFRNFFRDDTENEEIINIQNIFTYLEELTRNTLDVNFIQYISKIEKINLQINKNTLIQTFINLINNSKDAFIITHTETNNRYIFIETSIQDNTLRITFKDSAGGIPLEVIDKIFEPYFTTKHASIGTGIGLYMTNQIITKQLKGEITVENTLYEHDGKNLKGALFTILLPITYKI